HFERPAHVGMEAGAQLVGQGTARGPSSRRGDERGGGAHDAGVTGESLATFQAAMMGRFRPRASAQGASALGWALPAFQAEAFTRCDIASRRPPPTTTGGDKPLPYTETAGLGQAPPLHPRGPEEKEPRSFRTGARARSAGFSATSFG